MLPILRDRPEDRPSRGWRYLCVMETIQFISTSRMELQRLNTRVRAGSATKSERARYRSLVSSVRVVTNRALSTPPVLPQLLHALMG